MLPIKSAYVFLVVCLLGLNISLAQNAKIDSLKSTLGSDIDSIEYNSLIGLVIQYGSEQNNSEALKFAQRANAVAYQMGDTAKIVKSGRLIGQLFNRMENRDAIDILKRMAPIAKRNNLRNDYKVILNGLALAYTIQAEYDKALDIHLQSLILREEDGDKPQISISLNNIGFVYFKMKNYEKALDYYYRSLQLKNETNDTYDLDRLLINIGLSNVHLHNFNKANEYIRKGLAQCGKNCDYQIIIEGQFGLGVACYNEIKYDSAKDRFNESLRVAIKSGNRRFQAENYVYLGRIAIKENDSLAAKKYLQLSEDIAHQGGYNQLLMDTYKQFYLLYNQIRDFENGSIYQNKYITLKDSLIGEELVKNVSRIQTNYEERDNLNIIKLKEEDLVRQRNLNIAIGLIAVLAGLLVFVLYRSNSITRKVNSALSDAKGVIETQNHRLQNINRELDAKVKEKTADLQKANEDLDKANKALVRVNDELDNFIYKTSHDIRGPLASLKGICSVALMDVKDPLALDYLTKLDVSSGRLNVILTRLLIVNQINHAIVGREHIDFNGIVDDVLLLEKKKGLPERLEIRREIDAEINFQSDKDLVRIILENLIDNSIKFYNDSERIKPFVHIKIAVQNNEDVVVSVIDNGIGIAEAKPDKIFQMFSRASERSGTGGIGLYLSKLATEKLGGQINLRSTAEGYTEFYVSFPLKMQAS
ncbi:MAG: tetratricopeptide repeat-containing sensor histidine kinase [Cyclobacteriaceae bacterium]|nr:tetratricopeptide repeat-containing sensor histidine kinase [Cyclobacteriaceae bacterium]